MKAANKKVQITLGALYRRMSADFRAVRPEDHAACVMPMVVAARDPDSQANWTVEPLSSFCPFCRTLSGMIAAEYATRYQVRLFTEDLWQAEDAFSYYCAAD